MLLQKEMYMKIFYRSQNKYSRKKRNGGFSLIEVIIAMAVLAIVSVPLIRSFVLSANVNYNSQRTQSASNVAQSVSEVFGNLSLEDIVLKATGASYDDIIQTSESGSVNVASFGSSGFKLAYTNPDADTDLRKYAFVNIPDILSGSGKAYWTGDQGEKFYVSVVLDPTGSSVALDVNKYYKPSLTDIIGTNYVVYDEFTESDFEAVSKAENQGATGTYRSSTLTIGTDGDLTLVSEYCLSDGTSYYTGAIKNILPDDYDPGELAKEERDIYLFYTYYNTNGMDKLNIVNNSGKARNIYLIGASYAVMSGEEIADESTTINKNKLIYGSHIDVTWPGTITLHSNVLQNNADLSDENPSIYGVSLSQTDEKYTALYNVKIYVRYDEQDPNYENAESYIAGTPSMSGLYTSLTTVKEE